MGLDRDPYFFKKKVTRAPLGIPLDPYMDLSRDPYYFLEANDRSLGEQQGA